jgi:hypothetical protein
MKVTNEQKFKINIIAVLEDLQDQYMTELQPEFRQGLKMMLNDAAKHTKKFIRAVDNILGDEQGENFGVSADMIREMLEKEFNK